MNEGLKFIRVESPASKSNPCCVNEMKPRPLRRISSEWSWQDYLGQIKSRTSAFRMKYAVDPGLYAVGEPVPESDVFVSANYKLSFDILRRSLKGLDAWILVLDTKGINVWCAAGKRTFATDEVVQQIDQAGLSQVVNHRRIIIPQLGAVGVNAKALHQRTGFRVHFGPVHAGDIKKYLEAGYKKTPEMRTVRFSISDRLVLTPMEINPAMKKFPLFALVIFLIFGLQPSGILFKDAFSEGMPFIFLGMGSVFSGAVITPVLLPLIPFRSFAVKGLIAGIITLFMLIRATDFQDSHMLPLISSCLFFPLASSYIALQFTGSTTFTGMSGVKKELKASIPVYLFATAVSVLLLIIYRLIQWGIL